MSLNLPSLAVDSVCRSEGGGHFNLRLFSPSACIQAEQRKLEKKREKGEACDDERQHTGETEREGKERENGAAECVYVID